MTQDDIRAVVEKVLSNIENVPKQECTTSKKCDNEILLEASGRHVHLTKEAVEILFGEGVILTPKKELSQPGQFLSEQRLKIVTPKGEFTNVAVLGPERSAVQVELSATDCRPLGIKAPVNLSGDLTGAADVVLVTDKGCYNAANSTIISKAHIHLDTVSARGYGVSDGESVKVRVESKRPVTFEDVLVRVNENFRPAVHIDFDEANACLYSADAKAYLIKSEG